MRRHQMTSSVAAPRFPRFSWRIRPRLLRTLGTLLTACAASVCGAQPISGYDVVVLAGQSNMVGYHGPIDPKLDASDPRIFQWGRDAMSVATEPLQHPGQTTGTIGLGLTFAKNYANQRLQSGRGVLLVPVAAPGTGFSTECWNPGNTCYETAVRRTTDALASNPNNRVVGFLWLQGEADVYAANA